ncbi:MAG: nitrophenyl compound nitroreductase subunit ArsF family protein [Candidatus Omnitrophica bacterium]|nr:nitrophenyl compound nitroreductase subunit ArsF family protein [Candidatus Omnitrophota bacterium]
MMRKCIFMIVSFLFFIGAVFALGAASKQDTPVRADIATPAQGNRVTAYYFHGNFRCYTCHTMEQYSKEAIQENFKNALSSGKLEFKVVNTDERGNEHYVNDYQLYTKSLVLSLLKDGKEIKSKNLTKIWEYVRDKQRFLEYVSEEVNNFLKEAK